MTICARVQVASGSKCVASVPLVMPFSTAHFTASVVFNDNSTSDDYRTVSYIYITAVSNS